MSNDKQFQDFRKEVEKLKEIDDAEEYAKQLAHLFLGNGLSLQTILLMAIDFGQQHPHWIPVEEELPEDINDIDHYSAKVLIGYFSDGDNYQCAAIYDHRNKEWHDTETWALMETPTHWMPIVPPRKEDNND